MLQAEVRMEAAALRQAQGRPGKATDGFAELEAELTALRRELSDLRRVLERQAEGKER